MNYFEYMAEYIGSGAVRLPVVELSTTLSNNVNLPDEESKKLTDAYNTGFPVVIKCNLSLSGGGFDVTNCSVVFSRGNIQGDFTAPAFFSSFGTTMLELVSIDGDWIFMEA